ncbi:MAG: ribosome silencing factor [Alphaproteobacteria bacterium]|nr:ribosome silencing factor [Alphaproteobacteria bacterium]
MTEAKTTKKTTTKKTVAKKTTSAVKKDTVKKTAVKKAPAKKKAAPKKALKPVARPVNPYCKKIADLVVKTLSDGKAEDIVTIDLTDKSALADYLIVASGSSTRTVCALAEQVQLRLKSTAISCSVEGEDVGNWCIVDAGDVIVHIFVPEIRETYCIEELWGEETPRRR